MMQHDTRTARFAVRPALWRTVCSCLLIAGCQAPAAHFSNADSASPLPYCSMVFARQIAKDSVVEMAYHPVESSKAIFAEPADHLWCLGRGAVGTRILMPLAPPPPPLTAERVSLDVAALDQELDQVLGTQLQSGDLRLLTDGNEALSALLRLIDSAKDRIDVLMFQWENDPLGNQLAHRLIARAASGVHVRILVDGGGNLIFGIPAHMHSTDVNAAITALANKPNIELIRTRNPFGRVDHRKLLLVDGRAAWTGGRNFTQQSFFGQHDVSFTVEGPLVKDLQAEFARFWEDQGGAKIEDRGLRNEDRPKTDLIRSALFNPQSAIRNPQSIARCRLLRTGPMNHQIETILFHALDHAGHHVYMENYTFCDSLLVYKLAQARQRGADVRVVLSFRDGTHALNRANRVVANRLLTAGVRVYVYPGMPHTKAAVVDGCWAYLGSGNFDPLSLRRNLEMGVAVSGCPFVQKVEQSVFQADLRDEWELKKPLPVTLNDYLCELVASFCL